MPPIEEFQVNFVVAIIIGALSFCWALATRQIRRYTFQRKFRVGGAYLSYFGDIQAGRTVWVKAPLRIRQRGADITADGKGGAAMILETKPDAKIICMTGNAGPPVPACTKFLPKPFTPPELIQCVEELLRGGS